MNIIEKYLYQNDLLKLTLKKVDRWIQNRNIQRVEFALEEGRYDIRLRCIQGLCVFDNYPLEEKLILCINDPVRVVSELAIHILSEISSNREILTQIEEKKRFWAENEYIQEANLDSVNSFSFQDSHFRKTMKESPSDRALRRLQDQTNRNSFG